MHRKTLKKSHIDKRWTRIESEGIHRGASSTPHTLPEGLGWDSLLHRIVSLEVVRSSQEVALLLHAKVINVDPDDHDKED
jgi:hypothetical protein